MKKHPNALLISTVVCVFLGILYFSREVQVSKRATTLFDTEDFFEGTDEKGNTASISTLSAEWSTSNPYPTKPWMSKQCIHLIEGVIQTVGGKHAVALEFGMGGSTAHFASKTSKYFAIEADPLFYEDVSKMPGIPSNAELKLVQKNQIQDSSHEDALIIRQHPYYDLMIRTMEGKEENHTSKLPGFESYILQASRFNVDRYDFVLIDGHARAAAAFYILEHIDPRSRVVIHDFFTDKMNNWLLCDLLKFYRVDSLTNEMQPYISGGSVIVLQKRKKMGARLTKPYGDIVDDAMHEYMQCP